LAPEVEWIGDQSLNVSEPLYSAVEEFLREILGCLSISVALRGIAGTAMDVDDFGEITQTADVGLKLPSVHRSVGNQADPNGEQMFECSVLSGDASTPNGIRGTSSDRESQSLPDVITVEVWQLQCSSELSSECRLP
jgi:hypothetical protein